jgi:hypothetical protein
MEVKIGVVYTPKELVLDIDGDADELMGRFDSAVSNGNPIVWLTDTKGKKIGVPADKLAYVEVTQEDETKRVGFGIA